MKNYKELENVTKDKLIDLINNGNLEIVEILFDCNCKKKDEKVIYDNFFSGTWIFYDENRDPKNIRMSTENFIKYIENELWWYRRNITFNVTIRVQ